MALKPQKTARKSSPDGLERHGFMRTHKVALALWKRSVLWLLIGTIKSHTDLVARSRALTRQIAAVSSSGGYDQFARLQRCKFLKTRRFPANSRLVSGQIDAYHIDPIYEFMT